MPHRTLHLVVAPTTAQLAAEVLPAVLSPTTLSVIKRGTRLTLIVQANASTPDMDVTDILLLAMLQLIPKKAIVALAAGLAEVPS